MARASKDPGAPKTSYGKGTVVSLFNSTKTPEKPTDVYCPHFWEMKYTNGCPYSCAWCYLQGTYRFTTKYNKLNGEMEKDGKAPTHKDRELIRREFEMALKDRDEPTMFNAGEVGDALNYENVLMYDVLPLLEKYADKGHKVLLLTKSDSKRLIGDAMKFTKIRKQIVFAYSVNGPRVAEQYEVGAPHPYDRLAAASTALARGYEVRLRIDPIVPIPSWQDDYAQLVDTIMKTTPGVSLITLGSLRGLAITIQAAEARGADTSWFRYLDKETEVEGSWGMKMNLKRRVEVYTVLERLLRTRKYAGPIGLCKESMELYDAMKRSLLENYCNCMMQAPPKKEAPPASLEAGARSLTDGKQVTLVEKGD